MKTILLKPNSHPEPVIHPDQLNCRGCTSFDSIKGHMTCCDGLYWLDGTPIAPKCFEYDPIFLAAKANMSNSIRLHGTTKHPDAKNAIRRATSLAPLPLKENLVELACFLGLDSEKDLA